MLCKKQKDVFCESTPGLYLEVLERIGQTRELAVHVFLSGKEVLVSFCRFFRL